MKNLARLSCLCLPILLAGCGGSPSGGTPVVEANLLVTDVEAGTVAYDSKRDLIYASVADGVVEVSPVTGKVVGSLGLSGSSRFTISSDCNYLYVDALGSVQKFNLATNTVEETIPDFYYKGNPSGGAIQISAASPANPNTVATISYYLTGPKVDQLYPVFIAAVHTSASGGADITPALSEANYTAGGSEGTTGFCGVQACPTGLCFNKTGSALYCTTPDNFLVPFNVSTGSTPPAKVNLGSLSFRPRVVEANGKVVVGGAVFSEPNLTQLGHFGAAGSEWIVAPVPNSQKAYGICPAQNGAPAFFARLNTETCQTEKTWAIANLAGTTGVNVIGFVNAGPHRVAFTAQSAIGAPTMLMIFNDPS